MTPTPEQEKFLSELRWAFRDGASDDKLLAIINTHALAAERERLRRNMETNLPRMIRMPDDIDLYAMGYEHARAIALALLQAPNTNQEPDKT